MNSSSPIGIFDSGIGGISVLKELVKLMPNENFLYYGDSQNAPYGIKSKEDVIKLSFNTTKYLLDNDVKAIVVACNTATSAAIQKLRETYKDKIIIGIEPAIKPAVLAKKDSKILVLATNLTLAEEKYISLKKMYKDNANIIDCPAPNIVKYVESCNTDSIDFLNYLTNLLSPYISQQIDSIVLGCTHFPFIKKYIKQVFPYDVTFYDGGLGAAKETKRLLEKNDLLNFQKSQGTIKIENSSSNSELITQSYKLLNFEV